MDNNKSLKRIFEKIPNKINQSEAHHLMSIVNNITNWHYVNNFTANELVIFYFEGYYQPWLRYDKSEFYYYKEFEVDGGIYEI